MPNLEGRWLENRYHVEQFIGRGGMSEVYRVFDRDMNAPLAMKVLHEDLVDDAVVIRSFRREAQALQRLRHPNIVPFYGMVETPEATFLLVHYVDGMTLRKILTQRKGQYLPLMEVLSYLKAISAALGYAHKNRVVHCDVKPANVMVDRGGNIYMTDFGIARHAESTRTSFGGMVGTVYYMAPEQFMEEGSVTPSTDIYALGVILFEMLTGRHPFIADMRDTGSSHGTIRQQVMHAHLKQPVPDPRSFAPGIPEGLVQVVSRALSKNPEERYQSIQEMYLAACQAVGVRPEDVPDRVSLPAVPATPPPPPVAGQFPEPAPKGKPRLIAWVAGGAGVAVIVGGIICLALVAFLAFNWDKLFGGGPGPVTTPISRREITSAPVIAPSKTPTLRPATQFPTSTPTVSRTPTPDYTRTRTPTPSRSPTRTATIVVATPYCYKHSNYSKLGGNQEALIIRRATIYDVPRFQTAENGDPYAIVDYLEPGEIIWVVRSPDSPKDYHNRSLFWMVRRCETCPNLGFVMEYFCRDAKDHPDPPVSGNGYFMVPYPYYP